MCLCCLLQVTCAVTCPCLLICEWVPACRSSEPHAIARHRLSSKHPRGPLFKCCPCAGEMVYVHGGELAVMDALLTKVGLREHDPC